METTNSVKSKVNVVEEDSDPFFGDSDSEEPLARKGNVCFEFSKKFLK